MPETRKSKTRWWMLALLAATGTFVAAMPASCMPVLFEEIAADLGLDLVEVGTIWGFTNLAGLVVSIIAGVLSDRLSARHILAVCGILGGLTGALRGVADNFTVLAVMVILNGVVRLAIPVSVTRAIGDWFKGERLGMAMGVGALGIGLGLTLGPLLSATVLSPWLGGWRNVMYFLGGLSALIGLLWWTVGREAPGAAAERAKGSISLFPAIKELVKVRAIWVLGLVLFFRTGAINGVIGYLPLYLRGQGWATAAADSSTSIFFAFSTVLVVPLSFLSDRLGSRKGIMMAAIITTTICFCLLPVADGFAVFAAMAIAGIFMDSFMAINTAVLMESGGFRPAYTGIAYGMMLTLGLGGSVISPPIGNALAEYGAGMPFYFWAALSFVSLFILLRCRPRPPVVPEPLQG